MKMITASIGGLIGGLIGAAIWAGITYFTNYEIGWIAWGVGFLVGLGVRMGAQDLEGAVPGGLAVLLAVLAVVGGKYAAASLIVSKVVAEHGITISAEDMKQSIAGEILEERKQKGPPINWPPGKNEETALSLHDYPVDIQQEALKRWDAIPPAEQQQKIEQQKQEIAQMRQMIQGFAHKAAFMASFGIMDLLFFGLAAFTAFKLGSGAESDSE